MGDVAFMGMILSVFFIFIAFMIGIGIMRWAFRINDIVERLDRVIELLPEPEIKSSPVEDHKHIPEPVIF
ncbi:MAG: hypothetical protein C0399_09550 [Syntrophus sp. (in: bacteria)]|nr:hypothetical protein [Syntrophus sp. (in: bacteria)]